MKKLIVIISIPFLLYRTPTLSGIHPSLSEPEGGTLVTIFGNNFFQPPTTTTPPSHNSTSVASLPLANPPIQCRFSTGLGGFSPATVGTFLSTNSMRCATPPRRWPAQLFAVAAVSFNAYSFHQGVFDGSGVCVFV